MRKNVKSFRFKETELGVFKKQASLAVQDLKKGSHIIGLTMGEFSLIDLIKSVLEKTGKANVYIATWSAGIKDVHNIKWMMDTDLIDDFKIITDHSYVNRQRTYAASITELFGKENIRCSEIHAKFTVIQNENWDVVIVSSMNLNANKTCETFTIYESEDVMNFYMDFIKHTLNSLEIGFTSDSATVMQSLKSYFDNNDEKQVVESKHWSEL